MSANRRPPLKAEGLIVGFTGTRSNLSEFQRDRIRRILTHPRVSVLHHGDCVGGDAFAHDVALAAGKSIIIHPPINHKLRAWRMGIDVEWWPEKGYLARDRDIVRCGVDFLLAAPSCEEVWRGSGTWYTIHYARRIGRKVRRLMP